jgi:hypothetical protein
MKNKLLVLAAWMAFACVMVIACEKKKDVTPPAYAEFTTSVASANVYYVTNDPNSQIKIPVGITTVSNVDRTVQIKDSSRGAVNGTQYTLPSSITIPAGKTVDTLVLKGLFAGYAGGRVDTLYIKIVNGADVPANSYNVTYTVILQAYCDVVGNDLIGDYTKTVDYDRNNSPSAQGAYKAVISNWTSTGPYSADIKITNLGWTSDVGFGDTDPVNYSTPGFLPGDPVLAGLTAHLDWTKPSKFTVTVPSQPYLLDSYGNGPSTISGTGSFSSCSQTFTIKLNVVDASAAYYPFTAVLKR